MLREIDTSQLMTYEGQLVCPKTGQSAPSIFCPYANECELPLIRVEAESHEDAKQRVENLVSTGQISECLLGERYLTKICGRYPIIMRLVDAA